VSHVFGVDEVHLLFSMVGDEDAGISGFRESGKFCVRKEI
jgi:hypothetical protein